MSNLPSAPEPSDVEQWMRNGESQTIEFKGTIPSVLGLAQVLGAFANAQGGVILIGVHEAPPRVTGITSWPQLGSIFDRALADLKPVPSTMLHQVRMPNGRVVGVIVVRSSKTLVVSSAGAYIRRGDRTLAMDRDEVQAKLTSQGQLPNPHEVADQYATLTSSITDLSDKVSYWQSWRGQWKGWLISALIGAVVGMPAGFLMSLAASFRYAEMTAMKEKETAGKKEVTPAAKETSSSVRVPSATTTASAPAPPTSAAPATDVGGGPHR